MRLRPIGLKVRAGRKDHGIENAYLFVLRRY